jgi:hypothetical protein
MNKLLLLSMLALVAFITSASAGGPIGTSGGPNIAPLACIAYQHSNFAGAKFTVNGNYDVSYVGSRWNDKISSIACNPYCRMTVYEHRDYKGRSHVFGSNIQFVGDFWNDRISSMKVRCSR